VQGPEFNPQYCQKKKEKKKEVSTPFPGAVTFSREKYLTLDDPSWRDPQ
jgi:hypothetical protein